ncbi:hypothetical protein LT85_3285 [Collimonas arenae]|uniref:Uncharacterized protein n=1 Tax=Collimonas arenae TaxID=279058 RepID=A0A0A1FCG1_9BURK|nr:hypothetical protein LT85_3285 [Collimonas arenae]
MNLTVDFDSSTTIGLSFCFFASRESGFLFAFNWCPPESGQY